LKGYKGAYGMNRTFKPAVAAVIFAVSFAGSAAAAPYEDAVAAFEKSVAAYEKGDYATAARLNVPLPRTATPRLNSASGTCITTARACRRTTRPL
jgi:hypothetical protein